MISKGKNKLDGVGEKCGELIDEYLETGTIAKIAEKKEAF
jgi:DNA polymerase/3'-5' exonuclease PolX